MLLLGVFLNLKLCSAGGHPHRHGVLDDAGFGQRYAYGMAEGAALNPLEPWKVAAAVGRDMGQFLLGSVGWKPAQANIEDDDSHFQHSACKYMNAKLKVRKFCKLLLGPHISGSLCFNTPKRPLMQPENFNSSQGMQRLT